MPRISRILFLFVATFTLMGVLSTAFDVVAQDKKGKKKDEKKDDKKDDKKVDKKEEKKEPFKPDNAQQEFKYVEKDKTSEKEKTFWVYTVAFGADGKTVAAAYRDNTVKIWDLNSKKDIQTLKGNPTETKGLVYGKTEVFVSTGKWNKEKKVWEGEIKIWDAKGGKAGKSLKGHAAAIEFVAVSKDGKFLATASEDKTVIIWDVAAGKDTQTIKGHTETVNSVSFSPDGKQVVTTSADKTVRVWDIAGAKEVASFKVERDVVKDAKGKVSKTKELGREFTRAVFTNDGKKIAAGNLDGVIKIYDVEGKKEVQELKAHEGVWALTLSPDGTKLATGGWDGTIKIWNFADGKELRTIKAHVNPTKSEEGGNVNSISFSPDGQWLASGGIDGIVKIWSVK